MACTTLYILIELLFINLPSFLFIAAGAINFKYVRSIGFNRVVKFSNWFKFKICLCWIMIAIDLLVAIMVVAHVDFWNWNFDGSSTSPLCMTFSGDGAAFRIAYVVLKLINAIVWYSSIKLLIYQYRKGLSEVWYSHKMFWVLHVAINSWALAYGIYTDNYKISNSVVKSIEILTQLILIVLMFKTVTRTADKPR